MRKLSADYIFTSVSSPIERGILVLEDDGTILDIIDTHGSLEEMADLEFYNGILVPGFVNCHSHIEFSWASNSIPMHTGVPGFIERMISLRHQMPDNLSEFCKRADYEMLINGISAVGDISSSSELLAMKSESKMSYVNFIEVLDSGQEVQMVFNHAIQLVKESEAQGIPAYIAPHSPYSVSSDLFRLIQSHQFSSVYSIHNQESNHENSWFRGEKNPLTDLFVRFGLKPDPIYSDGISSLQTICNYFPGKANILLIHNLATSLNDIEIARNASGNIFWVMCPNSNLYISNLLPDFNMFLSKNCTIALGTDSLVSNSSLSILDEIKTINAFYPGIALEELIKWGTINGARALRLDNKFGSFEKGKKPGVLLLQNIDLQTFMLSSSSSLKRII
jgi:cytosine/adenosine deaminase-related metal-dependent hydrolase